MIKEVEDKYEGCDNVKIHQEIRASIVLFFQNVPDPRAPDNCSYSLYEILFIIIMAVFAGADCIAGIAQYSKERSKQLSQVLGEDFTPPHYNTFWWILTRMDHKAFSECFYTWVKESQIQDLRGEQICIDGKTLRGALNKKGKANNHIVHALVAGRGLLIGQRKTEEKSNEITAIPALLEELDLRETVVTIDAAGCQKEIVKKISKKGGDYILGLKGNQKNLHKEVVVLFEDARVEGFEYVLNCDFYETVEKNGSRVERRSVAVIGDPSELSMGNEWEKLNSLIEVTRETAVKGGKPRIDKSYYISSLIESAKEIGEKIRGHWAVESMHWALDMMFKEDSSRANMLNGAMNLATVKRMAVNIVKGNPELKKKGMAKVRRWAQWNDDGTAFLEISKALFGVKSF